MYNAVNFRLNRILTLDKNSAKLQDLNYYYDKTGNITRIIDYVYTASQTFRYDALKRLTRAVGAYGDKTYTYDQIGNITRKDGLTYTYGGYGAGPHAVTSTSDGTSYRYDANGNMISKQTTKGKWTYVYDTENRLASIGYAPFSRNTAKPIANYYYDGDGGRVKKVVYRYQDLEYSNTETYGLLVTQLGAPTFTSSTVQTITSVYVGNLYEIEDSANGNPQRKTKSIFLGNTRVAGISFPSASVGNPDISYYHQDHLGSTNVMTDKLGVVRSLTEYDPYGKISRFEKFGDKLPSNWNYFHDKPFDDESGLIYFNARYYDPKLGRFISADTIVPRPENPQEFNRYSYCLNNPINRIDPSGHKSWWKKMGDFFKKAGSSILQAVGVLAAPFTGGASLYLTYAGMAWSGINAAQSGNFGAFAAGLGAGLLTAGFASAYLAPAMAGWMAAGSAVTAGQTAIITATEFALSGAVAGFAGTLAGGGSLKQAGIAAGMGFGIGAVSGGVIGYSYASGMQNVLHGFDSKGYNSTLQNYQAKWGTLNSAEQNFVRRHPIAAYKIMKAGNEAMAFAQNSGLSGIQDGPADAARHALWAGKSARSVGAGLAKEFTSLHESGSFNLQNYPSHAMDMYNNNAGIALAISPTNSGLPMQNVVMDAVHERRLFWLRE